MGVGGKDRDLFALGENVFTTDEQNSATNFDTIVKKIVHANEKIRKDQAYIRAESQKAINELKLSGQDLKDYIKRNIKPTKENLPFFLPGGYCPAGHSEEDLQPNGNIQFDADFKFVGGDKVAESLFHILCGDEYFKLLDISLSGFGIKGIVPTTNFDPLHYVDTVEQFYNYIVDRYGEQLCEILSLDNPRDFLKYCDNLSAVSPCFFWHGPKCHINRQATIFQAEVKEQQESEFTGFDPGLIDAEAASSIAEAFDKLEWQDGEWEKWYQVGYALYNLLGEEGWPLFDQLSRKSNKYQQRKTESTWKSIRKANPQRKRKAGFTTIKNFLQDWGIELPYPERESARKKGRPAKEKKEKVNKMWLILGHVANGFDIKRNEFTGNFELNGVPMEDEHFNNVYLSCYDRYFEETDGGNLDKPSVITAIESEYTPTYNPVIDYLEKVKGWNSKGAILELAASIDSDTGMQDGKFFPRYQEIFIRKWLINMVATAITNTDNPLLLAFLGKQGTGKTEWFRRLLPEELRPYYSETEISDDKDFYIEMSKKLLILDDELSGKSKVEMKSFKKIMSKQDITIRVPYGRKAKLMKRRASLAGTGNEMTILYDYTGNRRIIPVHILGIDHRKYNAIDKADVFSEAYNAFLSGEDFRLTRSDMDMLTGSTEEFNYVDYEADLADRYLIPGTIEGDTDNEYRYSAGELVELLSQVTTQRIFPVKIGHALNKFGYEKGQCRKKESTKLVRYAIHPDSPIFQAIKELEMDKFRYAHN